MNNLLLDVVTTAGILFVVAVGLLVVFGVLKIINFAHGGFLTIGGYAALIVTQLHWSPWAAPPVALILGILLGMLVERLIVRPLYSRPLDAILATWGLSIVVVQLITIGFGRGTEFVLSPLQGAVALLGTSYSLYRLAMLVVALVIEPLRNFHRADLGGNNGPLAMGLLRIWLFGLYLSSMESFFLDRSDPLWFTFLLAVFGLHYLARFRVRE